MLMPLALLADCSFSLKISFGHLPVSLAHPVSWLVWKKEAGEGPCFSLSHFIFLITEKGKMFCYYEVLQLIFI